MSLEANDVATLSSCPHFVAGFTDYAIEAREDLWDLLIDGRARFDGK